MKRLLALLLLVVLSSAARSEDFSALAWDQRPGAALPMDAPLRDGSGQATSLREVAGGLPLVIAPGYFRCPNLCGVVRDDLFSALSRSGLRPGQDYAVAVLSIDPAERPSDAAAARSGALDRYGSGETGSAAWRFLTGPAASVAAIQQAAGFRARYDGALQQFLHPAGLALATPDGRVSGYVLGVGYTPGDLETAVARARGGISALAQPVLLLCFHFDPQTGRYTLAVTKLVRLAAALTVLALGGTLFLAHRRPRKRAA